MSHQALPAHSSVPPQQTPTGLHGRPCGTCTPSPGQSKPAPHSCSNGREVERVETLSSASEKSRVWTSHRGSRLGSKGQGVSMQRHHCKAAFLSKGKSLTARVPTRAIPPGLPPACRPPTGLRWRCTAVRGRPAHRLTSSLSLQYESRLQPQRRETRGRGFGRSSRLPRSLPGRQCRGRVRAGGRGRSWGCARDRLRGVSPASPGVQRARLCSGGGREALRDPSCPPGLRHGRERKRRKLIAITYKGKRRVAPSRPR